MSSWQWQMYDSQRRNPRYLAMFSSEDASPEVKAFVQEVLREMDVKDPHKVRVWRFDEDADYLCWPTCIVVGLGCGWGRRYVCVREDGFQTLADGQKRFLIAREVVKWRLRLRQMFFLHLILLPVIAAAIFSFKCQCGFSWLTLRSVLLGGGWLLFAYRCRKWVCMIDLQTVKELGDLHGALGLIEKEQRYFDEYYRPATFCGDIARLFYTITRPFNMTPSPRSRLRYLQKQLFGKSRTSWDDEHEG